MPSSWNNSGTTSPRSASFSVSSSPPQLRSPRRLPRTETPYAYPSELSPLTISPYLASIEHVIHTKPEWTPEAVALGIQTGSSRSPSRYSDHSNRTPRMGSPGSQGTPVYSVFAPSVTTSSEYPSSSMTILPKSSFGCDQRGWSKYQTYKNPSETYGLLNLAPRPKEWRPDYRVKKSLFAKSPVMHDSEILDSADLELCGLLQCTKTSSEPSIYWDLRTEPELGLRFPALKRPHNNLDLIQYATRPPTERLRLYHPILPWYIDVVSKEPGKRRGVTVGDVVMALREQLLLSITHREFWAEDLGNEVRGVMEGACHDRMGNVPGTGTEYKRVDLLGRSCVLIGIGKKKRGVWEIKTVQV